MAQLSSLGVIEFVPHGTETKTNNKHTKHHMKKLVTLSAVLLVAVLIQSWQMAYAQTNAPKAKEQAPAVLIGGSGVSPHYENIVNDLQDSLKEQSVSAKVCEGHDLARSTLVDKAKEVGAGSVLYVAVYVNERLAYETTLSVQCLDADGTKLWEEKQKGPLMTSSVDSTVSIITEKMKKKIKAHVGKPGLPTSK